MMEFQIGDKVEVTSEEEGFLGSYYTATVMNKLDTDSYAVQYKNLVAEEDSSTPLIETVSVENLRPAPPKIRFGDAFSVLDKVDAFVNDGWWVGKVSGRGRGRGGSLYSIYFETTGDEIAYHVSRLRAHLDWVDGKWVSSKKRVSCSYLYGFAS